MIKKDNRIIGFPQFSPYSKHFLDLFNELGLKTLNAIPITDETIRLGTKHAPEMMCFPYKVVLGNFIQLLNEGANTLVMFSSCGTCKFRHYYKLVEQKLKKEGYDFEMIRLSPKDMLPIPLPTFMNKLAYLSGYNKYKIANISYKRWKRVAEVEKSYSGQQWGGINIGITGEIYSVLEPNINHNIKSQLEQMGATVHMTLSIRDLVTDSFRRSKERKNLREKCWEYFDRDGDPGGHGLHSVEDALLWSQKKIDGIIHITPLTCHPEILVEDAIDYICNDNKIPLLRIKIDETISPLNISTRVETFFELIKRKKVA